MADATFFDDSGEGGPPNWRRQLWNNNPRRIL
jgi:hypothetical protein